MLHDGRIFRKCSETYFKIGEKRAISVVNLGMIYMEAVVYNMDIAKNKDIGSENCSSGESSLTSERGLHNLGCVFKKMKRKRQE